MESMGGEKPGPVQRKELREAESKASEQDAEEALLEYENGVQADEDVAVESIEGKPDSIEETDEISAPDYSGAGSLNEGGSDNAMAAAFADAGYKKEEESSEDYTPPSREEMDRLKENLETEADAFNANSEKETEKDEIYVSKRDEKTPEGDGGDSDSLKNEGFDEGEGNENLEMFPETEALFNKYGINKEELEQIPGYTNLVPEQKALVAENLSQIILGRIENQSEYEVKEKNKEELTPYDEKLKKISETESTRIGKILKSSPTSIRKFAKQIGQGIQNSYKVTEAKIENREDIESGGMEAHGEYLKDFVLRAKDGPGVKYENGETKLQFIPNSEKFTKEERHAVEEFNLIANSFRKMPEEWRHASARPREQKSYEATRKAYDAAKERIVNMQLGQNGDAKSAAEYLNNIDNLVEMEREFSTHPEAMEELANIQNKGVWNQTMSRMLGNIGERKTYLTAGFLTRGVAAIAAGAAGSVAVGVGFGAYMGQKMEGRRQTERDREARHGTKDVSDTASNFINADEQIDKLSLLYNRFHDEENVTKQERILHSMEARLHFINTKDELGRINIGSGAKGLVNKRELIKMRELVKATHAVETEQFGPGEEKFNELFNAPDKKFHGDGDERRDILLDKLSAQQGKVEKGIKRSRFKGRTKAALRASVLAFALGGTTKTVLATDWTDVDVSSESTVPTPETNNTVDAAPEAVVSPNEISEKSSEENPFTYSEDSNEAVATDATEEPSVSPPKAPEEPVPSIYPTSEELSRLRGESLADESASTEPAIEESQVEEAKNDVEVEPAEDEAAEAEAEKTDDTTEALQECASPVAGVETMRPVSSGDNLWKLTESYLAEKGKFEGIDSDSPEDIQARRELIDVYDDIILSSDPEVAKSIGISSGNPHELSTSDVIDYGKFDQIILAHGHGQLTEEDILQMKEYDSEAGYERDPSEFGEKSGAEKVPGEPPVVEEKANQNDTISMGPYREDIEKIDMPDVDLGEPKSEADSMMDANPETSPQPDETITETKPDEVKSEEPPFPVSGAEASQNLAESEPGNVEDSTWNNFGTEEINNRTTKFTYSESDLNTWVPMWDDKQYTHASFNEKTEFYNENFKNKLIGDLKQSYSIEQAKNPDEFTGNIDELASLKEKQIRVQIIAHYMEMDVTEGSPLVLTDTGDGHAILNGTIVPEHIYDRFIRDIDAPNENANLENEIIVNENLGTPPERISTFADKMNIKTAQIKVAYIDGIPASINSIKIPQELLSELEIDTLNKADWTNIKIETYTIGGGDKGQEFADFKSKRMEEFEKFKTESEELNDKKVPVPDELEGELAEENIDKVPTENAGAEKVPPGVLRDQWRIERRNMYIEQGDSPTTASMKAGRDTMIEYDKVFEQPANNDSPEKIDPAIETNEPAADSESIESEGSQIGGGDKGPQNEMAEGEDGADTVTSGGESPSELEKAPEEKVSPHMVNSAGEPVVHYSNREGVQVVNDLYTSEPATAKELSDVEYLRTHVMNDVDGKHLKEMYKDSEAANQMRQEMAEVFETEDYERDRLRAQKRLDKQQFNEAAKQWEERNVERLEDNAKDKSHSRAKRAWDKTRAIDNERKLGLAKAKFKVLHAEKFSFGPEKEWNEIKDMRMEDVTGKKFGSWTNREINSIERTNRSQFAKFIQPMIDEVPFNKDEELETYLYRVAGIRSGGNPSVT